MEDNFAFTKLQQPEDILIEAICTAMSSCLCYSPKKEIDKKFQQLNPRFCLPESWKKVAI
ncbi:hypothetical protein SCA6_004552 [Theobroma cacao]